MNSRGQKPGMDEMLRRDGKMHKISIKSLVLRFKWRISFTLFLVISESFVDVFFPLFLGLAIEDLLVKSYDGFFYLLALGVAAVIIGGARRFYDTRIYAGIYTLIASEMVENENNKNSLVSTISARANLLTEFVEFFENSMPELVGSLIALVGALLIIATLNISIFFACFAVLLLILLIYIVTGKLNFRLNTGYNNELERQVTAITSQQQNKTNRHFKRLMSWNIKLSDLETVNYTIIWIAIIALIVYTPWEIVDSGVLKYGLILSTVMYVMNFIENAVDFPLHIQQIIRLSEISQRLDK